MSSALLLFCSCGFDSERNGKEQSEEEPTAEVEDIIRERGSKITKEAFQALSGALQEKIQEGGVASALEYCSENALPLTDSVGEAHDVTLRRISDRYRNPENKPTNAEAEVLASFQKNLQSGEPAGSYVDQTENEHVFYSPIVINNTLCLNCHGDVENDISREDYITISLLYPDDRATGYNMGDLRGMWQVKFTKPGL